MKWIRRTALVMSLVLTSGSALWGQHVPEHISRVDIYDFLDELANIHVIQLNTVARPYNREMIAELLAGVDATGLGKRQVRELEFYKGIYLSPVEEVDTTVFYLHELFRKDGSLPGLPPDRYDLFSRRDGIFSLTVNPVIGLMYAGNGDSSMYHRWNGLEAYASVGGQFSCYASLRDNKETIRLSDPLYVTDRQGANYKLHGAGGDYSEMRAGVTWAWNWGELSLRKDHFSWGNNYHGANIFSGHQPSFAFIDLKMAPAPWFEFRYVHGWLVSEVIDSARSYAYVNSYGVGQRKVFVGKYLAANMISIRAFPRTWISVGNSIIYSDIGFHPAYLIPLGFYKSIDHTYNGTGSNALGHNSQMFADLSIREIPHTHLFLTLFVDEIAFSHMWDQDEHSNLYSAKAGARISGLPFPNTGMTIEYTRTNPLAFQHTMPVTTFASNHYNLGHYLRDNAEELYLDAYWKPVRNFHLLAWYNKSRKGPDYNALGGELKGLPFIADEVWSLSTLGLRADYQLFNNLRIGISYTSHRSGGSDPDASGLYLPPILHGPGGVFSFHAGLGR